MPGSDFLKVRKTLEPKKIRETKKVKNFILAALAALLMLCLAACKMQHGVIGSGENLPKLVVGSDEYAPYVYYGKNNEIMGTDAELAKEVCRRIGRKFVFKEIKWDEKDSYLESGDVDCLWGSFSMNGREDDYMWTEPYNVSRHVVVVRTDSGITKLSELEGKRVAVQSSTKPEEIFLSRSTSNVPSVDKVFSLVGIDEIFAALSRGYVDACSGHEEALRYHMKNLAESYRVLDEPIAVSQIGVAFAKNGDSELVSQVSKALVEMKNDGTVDSILKKYTTTPVTESE